MSHQIHRLHPDLPDPVESRRKGAGRIVRLVYASTILLILGFFLWRFGTPALFLNGPGIVQAPRFIISVPYVAHVKQVEVSPGAAVLAGALIAQVTSPQVDEVSSNLLRALAEVAGREAELRVKARVANASLAAAKSRSTMAEEAMQRLDRGPSLETTSLIYRGEVYRERSLAVQNVAALEAEAAEAVAQLDRLAAIGAKIQDQLDQVRRDFADGRIVSTTSGVIAPRGSKAGETVTAGTALAEVLQASETFVDWYIPQFRWVDPQPGQKVFVIWGKARLSGVVTEVLPIADQIDANRNSILREPPAGQLARVRFDAGVEPPPLNSMVQVRMFYSDATDHLARALARLFRVG